MKPYLHRHKILETERLVIRKFTTEDTAFIMVYQKLFVLPGAEKEMLLFKASQLLQGQSTAKIFPAGAGLVNKL